MPAGNTTLAVRIKALNDYLEESTETLQLGLTEQGGAACIGALGGTGVEGDGLMVLSSTQMAPKFVFSRA